MKKLIILSVIIIGGLFGANDANAQYRVSNYFYTGLHPYGTWIEIDYGVVVWRPTIMRRDWSPYLEGRWIWTTDGWYWHSYEPFGYITYHYGRWYYDDYYGWLWVPGYEFAPAWVEWRYGDDYIGWAPLHPYTTIYITIGVVYPHNYYNPYYHWNFVTYNHFYDPYVYSYCVEPRYKYRVHSKTRYRTNYVSQNGRIRNNGVDIAIVRNRSGQQILERNLVRVSDEKTLNRNDRIENDKIRTIYKSRDELIKNEASGIESKRLKHRTSLDLSKVQMREVKEREQINSKLNERKNQINIRTDEKTKISGTSDRTQQPRKDVVREKNSQDNSQVKNIIRRNNGLNKKSNKEKNSSLNRNVQSPEKKSIQQDVNRNKNNDKNVRTKTINRNSNNNQKMVSPKNNNDNQSNRKNSSINQKTKKSSSDKNNKRTITRR